MKPILLLCSTLVCTVVSAHSTKMLIAQERGKNAKCSKTQTVLLGKMTLSAGTFKHLKSEGNNVCNVSNSKMFNDNTIRPKLDCGQFDDWRLAYDMGNQMCKTLRDNMLQYSDTVTFQTPIFTRFEGPFEFKGDRHHELYEASMGVTFSCYMCEVNR
jgi:hypothetical protein